MSLATIQTALVGVIGVALSARTTYSGSPNLKPLTIPAVATDWLSTEQSTRADGTHSHISIASGKTGKRGAYRIHRFMVRALLSTTGDAPAEGVVELAAVQKVLDAIDADATLRGALCDEDQCTWCDIENIAPLMETWDGTVYSGIQITVRIQEL